MYNPLFIDRMLNMSVEVLKSSQGATLLIDLWK